LSNIFVFVTTFVAKDAAIDLFSRKGIAKDSYFICEREYIDHSNINSRV
jgi:hypothetical protein